MRSSAENAATFLHTAPDIDPLIRLAVAHYQFEAIHPFTDGNGRTGRILNILYLLEEGLLSVPILCLSRTILRTKGDCYDLLAGVTAAQNWHDWIVYMLGAIEQTSHWTR